MRPGAPPRARSAQAAAACYVFRSAARRDVRLPRRHESLFVAGRRPTRPLPRAPRGRVVVATEGAAAAARRRSFALLAMPGGGDARSRDTGQPGSPLGGADWDAAASEAGHAHGGNAPHLASPRKRRERERHSLGAGALAAGLAAVPRQATALCGRVEARYVAFVGMFFVTLTAASLYSLLAPFFPSVAGARSLSAPLPRPLAPPGRAGAWARATRRRCARASGVVRAARPAAARRSALTLAARCGAAPTRAHAPAGDRSRHAAAPALYSTRRRPAVPHRASLAHRVR